MASVDSNGIPDGLDFITNDGIPLPQQAKPLPKPDRFYKSGHLASVRVGLSQIMKLSEPRPPFNDAPFLDSFEKLTVSEAELKNPRLKDVKAEIMVIARDRALGIDLAWHTYIPKALRENSFPPETQLTVNGDSPEGRRVMSLVDYVRSKLIVLKVMGGRWPETEEKDIRTAVQQQLARMRGSSKRPPAA